MLRTSWPSGGSTRVKVVSNGPSLSAHSRSATRGGWPAAPPSTLTERLPAVRPRTSGCGSGSGAAGPAAAAAASSAAPRYSRSVMKMPPCSTNPNLTSSRGGSAAAGVGRGDGARSSANRTLPAADVSPGGWRATQACREPNAKQVAPAGRHRQLCSANSLLQVLPCLVQASPLLPPSFIGRGTHSRPGGCNQRAPWWCDVPLIDRNTVQVVWQRHCTRLLAMLPPWRQVAAAAAAASASTAQAPHSASIAPGSPSGATPDLSSQ